MVSRLMVDWAPLLAQQATGSDSTLTDILAMANNQEVISFSGGFPSPDVFPRESLAASAVDLITRDAGVSLQYSPSQGIASVIDAISGLLAERDGLRPALGELMVTSGGIDAVTLLARTMLDPGDMVVVEEPTYLGAITGFAATLAPTIVGVPTDEDGLRVYDLDSLLREGRTPKLLYVIPDYHNPTSRTLSVERRHQLVALCRDHRILIVEDVAYRELGFDDVRPPSLWSLAPDCVVQIGTFSKTFFPGVRLGWAAGPATIIERLAIAKQNTDQCAGAFGQRLVESFLRSGEFATQVERERVFYRERGQAMSKALAAHMPADVVWEQPRGGFFCWVRVPGVDTRCLAARAMAAGVSCVPGTPFFTSTEDHSHLRLSFSRATAEQIDRGIAILAQTLVDARSA